MTAQKNITRNMIIVMTTENDFPLITISISAYTSSDTIEDAINSAIAQDWPNKEILIADDASTDNTVEVIERLIEGHDYIRLLKYPHNKGFAQSLNTLISEAKGEFFAIFDDDDVSKPDRLTRQYQRIVTYEKTHDTDMVICHTARIQTFQNGYERYEPTMGTKNGLAPHGDTVADRILYGRIVGDVVGSCANCSRMARIDVFRNMGGYASDMTRGEDTEFNIKFALSGGHFVGIADPLTSQTMTMGREKTLDQEKKAEIYVVEKNKNYLSQKGWYSFCIKWIDVRHYYLNQHKFKFMCRLISLFIRHPFKVMLKIFWAFPACNTRKDFKKWHHKEFN